jgi:sugar phosphate isomerase/epimerase
MERRNFLSGAAAAAAAAFTVKETAFPAEAAAQATAKGKIVRDAGPQLVTQLWSRHLQWVSTKAEAASDPYGTGVKIGEALLTSGYAAVDLTVRSDGHVEPALVATNLPLMLSGIRSTGAICDMIGTNFAPPTDPANTAWIAGQFVHEILSVAGANGIKMYRFNNSGGASFASNTFGEQMTALLDGVRLNHRRLAAINAQYGVGGVAHTHSSNIGTSVEPYVYSMQGIDPNLLGINLAIGHVATAAPGTTWQTAIRRAMPYIKCTAVEDLVATVNATTGALSISRTQPTGATGTGGGVINWATFYQLLRLGGYSGAAESQIEYTITGANGTSVSLNSAFWADNAQFTSGNLSAAVMTSAMKKDSDFIRQRAVAGGWTAAQIL